MRFYKPLPQDGDMRTKTFFAFLPVRVNSEVRWLEVVRVRQRLHIYPGDYSWENIVFLN